MSKLTYVLKKDVKVIGTKAARNHRDQWNIDGNNKVVFEKDGIRYTGDCVYDPHFDEHQIRNIRKNSKAYVLEFDPYTYRVTRR
jgi:hypothetical protein